MLINMPRLLDRLRRFTNELARTLWFVFLILGLPVIIFLPSAFRMPGWWEPTINTLLHAAILVPAGLLAGGTSWLWWLAVRDWRRGLRPSRPVRAAIGVIFLAYFAALMWYVTIRTIIGLAGY